MLGGRNPESITILMLIVSSIGLDSDETRPRLGSRPPAYQPPVQTRTPGSDESAAEKVRSVLYLGDRGGMGDSRIECRRTNESQVDEEPLL